MRAWFKCVLALGFIGAAMSDEVSLEQLHGGTACWPLGGHEPFTTGQTFTAPATGILTSISLALQSYWYTPHSDESPAPQRKSKVVLAIFDGLGFDTELHRQTVDVIHSNAGMYVARINQPIESFTINSDFYLVRNKNYTIGFALADSADSLDSSESIEEYYINNVELAEVSTASPLASGAVCVSGNNPYATGSYFFNGTNIESADARFKLTIQTDTIRINLEQIKKALAQTNAETNECLQYLTFNI